MIIDKFKGLLGRKTQRPKNFEAKTLKHSEASTQTEEQMDFMSYSARNPGTTAVGAGISTFIAAAIPGVIAGVAAATIPILGPIAGVLNMFSAFSIATSGASAYRSAKKSKRAFKRNAREMHHSEMAGKPIPKRGNLLSAVKTLAKTCAKQTAIGTGIAAAASAGVMLGLSVPFAPAVGLAFAAGATYLMLPGLTHNYWNSGAVPS